MLAAPEAQGLYDPRHEKDACGVGFVVHLKGHASRSIVAQGLELLHNLEHRGACGCEANTGDGAGILVQVPHRFLRKVTGPLGFTLPAKGRYGTGLVFLPHDAAARADLMARFEALIADERQVILGWRDVPTDDSTLGDSARRAQPVFKQIFVGIGEETAAATDPLAFERKLYVIRKRLEHQVDALEMADKKAFYVVSLSARTMIWKGMLTAAQLPEFFVDLRDADLESSLALVHQRFSTNTFPSWPLAHPYRVIAHNGEINTLRGNINWMRAREGLLSSPLFAEGDLQQLLPVIREGGSDTATFDNVLEFLLMSGRSLPHAMLMMIPEPWQNHESMDPSRRAFYEYHSALMEPWDGPAAMAFSDGTMIGAVLDRNGLRPSRYYVTKDDLVIMASEVGVLDIPDENIRCKERLHPGKVFLVDTALGRIVDDQEIKSALAAAQPYQRWLSEHLIDIRDLPPAPHLPLPDHTTVLRRQRAFGYTEEDLRLLLGPMAQNGEEATGSMGTDTALAVLSAKPRLLFDYFKQLFAQVTNPPLDAIREELITSMASTIGPEGNLLDPKPESCRQIEVKYPVLSNEEVAKLRCVGSDDNALSIQPACPTPPAIGGFKTRTLPMLFDPTQDGPGLERAIAELCAAASAALKDGANILILSDRGLDDTHAAIPSLLATAGVHHHLVREGARTKCALVVEAGDAREVHHCALLIGYGAGAVNPYLAFETFDDMIRNGMLPGLTHKKAVANYVKALNKGILKVMSKMGISTLQSYCGAQIFEAIGLKEAFVDRYFTWTPSRIEGIGIEMVAEEVCRRHELAYPTRPVKVDALETGGEYQWRRDGEYHLFNPQTVFKLQHATRSGQYSVFKEYSKAVDDQSRELATLRGLMTFKTSAPGSASGAIPIDEVEPVEAILKRFSTGAMSYGSISSEAHETLAIAMNRMGGRSNSGEGGEDSRRYSRDENGDWRRSAVKQVASGRFGVTSEYLVNATDLQIKMAQGAKPGEGGQLPGPKVYPWIAKVRFSTPGVTLISPPPHHDIYSIEDIAQLIHDLKNANPEARIHVKLVAEAGVGTVAAGVCKAHADVVLVSGHDGGTGASPLTSIKHGGVPWELGLAETQQVLLMNGLRSRIVVQVDGQMKTGRDVVIAALLGAEEFGFATAPLVVSGCVMMRVCHLNTCPVGIATQDPELRARFTGKPEFVEHFFRFIAQEVRELMAELGFRTVDEMVGRAERLDVAKALDHWKANGLDYSQILFQPTLPANAPLRCVSSQDHGLDRALDNELIARARPAIEQRAPVAFTTPIRNVNRTVGTLLGYEVTKRWGAAGLPDETIKIHFTGHAGQSFAAFVPRGITLTLEGDANDYVGKGLSGGRVVVFPPKTSTFAPEENILIGNVALYGATSGEAFFRGIAGERFAVRNSGVHTVIEGVGDHACEYMTGGRVVVLGRTGRNFAAGMSGGVAYVLDVDRRFQTRCNPGLVDLEPIEDSDEELLRLLITRHIQATGSDHAAKLMLHWSHTREQFVKVMPRDYKRVLAAEAAARAEGRDAGFAELIGAQQ
ncbi:MAG: glutamate synthase large subunit [Vicinamibacteraceae bacterium]